LRPTLEFVCSVFAQWDDAALFSRIDAFEKQLMRGLAGDLALKVKPHVQRGCVVMPPAALTQLIREVIEWCDDVEVASVVIGGEQKSLSFNEFIRLVLSINGDQERQSKPDCFESWPPTESSQKQLATSAGGASRSWASRDVLPSVGGLERSGDGDLTE
jgi:hypothetical protein